VRCDSPRKSGRVLGTRTYLIDVSTVQCAGFSDLVDGNKLAFEAVHKPRRASRGKSSEVEARPAAHIASVPLGSAIGRIGIGTEHELAGEPPAIRKGRSIR